VNYKQHHVYKVVGDVAKYEEFVPWCSKSRIVEEISPKEKLADLTVGFYGMAEETFRSHVILDPYRSVTALASSDLYTNSPLKRLKNVWTFEPSGENRTKVSMELEFEFFNPVYTRLTSHFLKRISNMAMTSFVARCGSIKEDLDEHPSSIDPLKAAAAAVHFTDHSFREIGDSFESLTSCAAHLNEEEIEFLAHDYARLSESSEPAAGKLFKDALRKWLGHCDERVSDRVFQAMDVDKNGTLTLREFIRGVSLIARGTPEEKRYGWFRNRSDEEISREELELITMCTLIVRDSLSLCTNHQSVLYERPDVTSVRMVAPVFRGSYVNKRALERLFATL